MSEPQESPHPSSGSDQLSPKERGWSAVLAVMALGAGGVATFMTENGAGTAALVVAGLVMGVFALTGQALSRFKIGDTDVEFATKVGRKTLELAESDSSDPDIRAAARSVVEDVADRSAEVPSSVRRLEKAAGYENAVVSALTRAYGQELADIRKRTGLDAVIGDVGVEIKYRQAGRPPGHGSLTGAGQYAAAVNVAARERRKALLIVTNSAVADPDPISIDGQNGEPTVRVRILQWVESMGEAVLKDALDELTAI